MLRGSREKAWNDIFTDIKLCKRCGTPLEEDYKFVCCPYCRKIRVKQTQKWRKKQ